MSIFFKQVVRRFKTTGAIAPVRKKTAKKLTDLHEDAIRKSLNIVELGAGTGVIAEELLKRMKNNATLYLIEINDDFCKFLEEKFKNDRRVVVLQRNAVKSDWTLPIDEVDLIISSVPLSLFSKIDQRSIIRNIRNYLQSTTGKFVQYQYSTRSKRLIEDIFNSKVSTIFTMSNIVPTFLMSVKA